MYVNDHTGKSSAKSTKLFTNGGNLSFFLTIFLFKLEVFLKIKTVFLWLEAFFDSKDKETKTIFVRQETTN